MNNEKMNFCAALIEWESSGITDVPTGNINEFIGALISELENRSEPTPSDKVCELLVGIDQDEIECDDGYWVTSSGVDYGKIVLNSIKEALKWT